MSTAQVALDTTQYVRVNVGLNRLMLQSMRDAVRIVVSDAKPAVSNTSFHILTGADSPLQFDTVDTNVWALATSVDNCTLIVTEIDAPVLVDPALFRTAAGQVVTATDHPLIQITAQYGILDDMLQANLGGTTTSQDSKFIASTGTGANNVTAIVSRHQAKHRVGQGLKGMVNAIFTQGVADNTQQAGFISSDSGFGFGYNGAEFGVVYATGGEVEIQELTITSGANSNETALVVVDSIGHSIALTSGSAELNAYEIAIWVDANDPRYDATSNGDVVTVVSQLPDFGGGIFTFSSNTATASWSETQAAVMATEIWTSKADWNVNPTIELDPTKLNMYVIQFESLAGSVNFYIQDSNTAELTLVHIIKYCNRFDVPIVDEAVFRVGWASRNTGNASDIIVQGTSAAVMLEGELVFTKSPHADDNENSSVGSSRSNVIALRNRQAFNGETNRTEIYPLNMFLFTESNKTTIFDVMRNVTLPAGQYPAWEYFDEDVSTAEVAKNGFDISSGEVLMSIAAKANSPEQVNLRDLLEALEPSDYMIVSARLVGSGQTAETGVSMSWAEDK